MSGDGERGAQDPHLGPALEHVGDVLDRGEAERHRNPVEDAVDHLIELHVAVDGQEQGGELDGLLHDADDARGDEAGRYEGL